MKYLISFALPRFCDQSLDRSRKERFYRRASDAWIAKLDTVIHELYHIDPEQNGIRRIERADGTYSAHCHGPQFFEQVARDGVGVSRLATRSRRRTISSSTISTTLEHASRRRRRHQLPHVPVLPAAIHRAARRAAAVRCALASVDVEPWREGRRRDALLRRQTCTSASSLLEHVAGDSRIKRARPRSLVGCESSNSRSDGSTSSGSVSARRERRRASLARGRTVSTQCDADMRRTRRRRREEDQVARLLLARRYRNAHLELLACLSRQRHSGLREHVLREAAAVEPAQI